MKRESLTSRDDGVDEGVSVYDRDRVEGVEFSPHYFALVEKASKVFGHNNRPRDIFNLYRGRKPESIPPTELVLPRGVDPHEPIKYMAKACVDLAQGFGMNSIISVDTGKASRFARATDLALNKITRQEDAGLLGFAFVVVRQEDMPLTAHENGREAALNGGAPAAETMSPDEAERLARVEHLSKSIAELNVPSLVLVTVGPYGQDADLGTSLVEGPGLGPDLV